MSSLKNSKFRAMEGQEVSFTRFALVTNLELGWNNLSQTNFNMCLKGKLNETCAM